MQHRPTEKGRRTDAKSAMRQVNAFRLLPSVDRMLGKAGNAVKGDGAAVRAGK